MQILQSKFLSLLKDSVASFFTEGDEGEDSPKKKGEYVEVEREKQNLGNQEPASLVELIENESIFNDFVIEVPNISENFKSKEEFINLIKLKYE